MDFTHHPEHWTLIVEFEPEREDAFACVDIMAFPPGVGVGYEKAWAIVDHKDCYTLLEFRNQHTSSTYCKGIFDVMWALRASVEEWLRTKQSPGG